MRERMQALESYVDKAAHHPVLSQSLDLLFFLEASDEGLEAARSFIEAVEEEEAESILSKSVEIVSSLAGRDAAPPLALKADEAFVQACALHGSALARLTQAVKTASSLQEAQVASAMASLDLGKALLTLAAHERMHASAGTSAAAAVAAAANAAKRAETALFTAPTGNRQSTSAADNAAAAAFASHTAVAGQDRSTIASMFQADFHDPYSALHSAAPPPQPADGGRSLSAAAPGENLSDFLSAAGEQVSTTAIRYREQLFQLEEALLKHLKQERDKEAELGEAIKRRDAAIDKVQEANATLQRKKKTLAGLKSTSKDYAKQNAEASAAVEKADKAMTQRKEDLEKMTEVLKGEMGRVSKERRLASVAHVAEYARLQAAHARERTDAWNGLLSSLTSSPAELDASRERVSAIARKAEQKARSASAARAKAAAGAAGGAAAGAGSSPVAAGGAAAAAAAASAGGSSDASMPVFGEDASGGTVPHGDM